MRRSSLAFCILMATWTMNAQSYMELRNEFRMLFDKAHPEMTNITKEIFAYADSLYSSDNAIWLQKLDSISSDTLNTGTLELPIDLEKHGYFQMKNKTGLAMNSLKRAHAANAREDIQSELFRFSSRYFIRQFESSGEMSFALRAMQGLLLSQENELLSNRERSKFLIDSMSQELQTNRANFEMKSAADSAKQKRLLQGLAAAGLFIVILLVVLFIYKWKFKKKLKALSEKQKDTSEVDELIKKMEVLKSETHQFKQTAQLTIDKLNVMDASGRKAGAELQFLHTDIVKSLEELRQQCEHNKASISPPVFMALQNIATRLGNASSERIQKIQDHLK